MLIELLVLLESGHRRGRSMAGHGMRRRMSICGCGGILVGIGEQGLAARSKCRGWDACGVTGHLEAAFKKVRTIPTDMRDWDLIGDLKETILNFDTWLQTIHRSFIYDFGWSQC